MFKTKKCVLNDTQNMTCFVSGLFFRSSASLLYSFISSSVFGEGIAQAFQMAMQTLDHLNATELLNPSVLESNLEALEINYLMGLALEKVCTLML